MDVPRKHDRKHIPIWGGSLETQTRIQTPKTGEFHVTMKRGPILKSAFALLLCSMMLVSTANSTSVYPTKRKPPARRVGEAPPGEDPIILIDYANVETLDSFDWFFSEYGLTVSFVNQSKGSEAIHIVIYVELYGLRDLSSFDFKIDNDALIDRSLIDLCDKDLNFVGNYDSFKIGNSSGNIDIDGNNLILRAKNISAYCAKLTITIGNWSPSVKYNLTVIPEFQGGAPEPPPMEGEADVYVLYDAQGSLLDVFNVSSTKGGMDVFFSNGSAAAETVDILLYAGIEVVQYISGFNATVDNGAKIIEGSIDLCDDNRTLIKNYQTFDLGNGVAVHSVRFDPENLIERIRNFDASFVRFRITISGWNSRTLYILHIQPFFREILYYETEDTAYVDPSTLKLPPELRVSWQRYNETRSGNWTHQDIFWEFGPSVHYEIFGHNSSSGWYEVTSDAWIKLDSDVKINVKVPKLLFEGGTELGQFEIHWNMWAVNISASLSIRYFVIDDQWHSHSHIQNYSIPEDYPETHKDETAQFFTLNESKTHVSALADYYYIEITGQFNDLTPKGIYHVDFNLYDNRSNYISSQSYFPETGTSKQVAIGGPWSEVATYHEKMLGGTYTAWIMNTDYEPVRSIGFNETFITKVEVTGLLDSSLANVSVVFPLPGDMKSYINVIGWHEEYKVHHGGWIYNKTLNNYVWDANTTIITREWIHGPYMEETWEDWSSYHKKVNVTRWEWNGTHHNPRTYTEHIMPNIFIFYNNLDESFGSYLVYEYYNNTLKEDEKGQQWVSCRRHIKIEEAPAEIMFYQILNVTKKAEENNVSVEFEGKFIKKLISDLQLDYHVFSVEREIWPNWELMEDNARFISIEKPVITVKIFDDEGDGSDCGDHIADPGEWFIIEAKTEGSSDLKTDVDGMRIRFECHDDYWSENETIWSRLEIFTTVNLRENTYTTAVYNETCKNVFEYGTCEKWNETTGRIEEVETWHWEYYTMNQTSGEWFKGGLPGHSDDMTIDGTYLTVNGFENFTTDDGRYIVQVNMSFTEQADDRRYHFDVDFLNWTYGPDYSKPWGEYLSEDWIYTTVYTVNDGSVEVYVPKPEEKNYVEDSQGTKYLISSKPYIEINEEELSLKEIKYWNGYEYEYRLLKEEWDYTTGQHKHYYTLKNNTRIYVFEAYNAPIYNMTLCNDDYNETVLTCMEWDRWDRFSNKRFLIALDGTLIWLEEDTKLCDRTQIAKVPVEFAGYFVLINGTKWENVTKGGFDWDSRVGREYIEFTNGTRVYVEYDSENMHSWYFERDGERYYIDGSWEYYSGEYSGSAMIVPRWCRRTWYYASVNEERVEVPYEGASSEYEWLSWWDLGRTKSEGGPVPENDYALVNGSQYPVNYYEGFDLLGFIVVDGEVVNVTKGRSLYTKVGGNDVWDVAEIGFRMFLANLTKHGTYDVDHLIKLQVANYFYYSDENITFVLLDDTSLTAQNRIRVMFHELKLNDTVHYVANYRPFFNHTTGTYIFHLLNGSEIEIAKSEKYQIVKTIAKDIGVNQWPIPKNFTWQEETYNTTLTSDSTGWIELWYTYYCVDVNGCRYDIVPISVLEKTSAPWDDIVPRYPDSDPWTYREKFTICNATLNDGVTTYTLYPRLDYIRVVHPSSGHPYEWHLEEFPWESIAIKKQTHNIIVGAPEWGLWSYRKFTIDPETGALDLDGDLDTTGDQFFVRRVYDGGYSSTETRNGLDVHLVYDPNPVIPEDELTVNAWMGIATHTYRNTWNETYFWYYPNMTLVPPETMSLINETVWDMERNAPNPGYWDISTMTINMTWEDYLRKAEKEGWHWVDEEATWTWLWFGFEQSYWASEEKEDETFQSYNVRLRYEYAGMFIYNDTNGDSMMGMEEETHYFMPNAISDVAFITPEAESYIADFDDTQDYLSLPTNESLEFGVSYLGINGTMFPSGRNYYSWYGEDVSGTDLRTFNERPVDAGLDELSFRIHFYVENSTEANSTEAHVKIDQHVGDWRLDVPSNISVLENLSLSLNYYVHPEMSGSWSVTSKNGSSISPNDIVEASRLSLDISGLKFADVNMGDTYVWGGNLSMPYNVSSYTVPLNTFIDTYTSYGSETSVGGWTFLSTMYFLSVGFPTWDGHYVYEDPEVVVYLGNGKRTIIGSPKEFLPGWNPLVIQPEEQPEEPGPMEGSEPLWVQWWFIVLISAVVATLVVTLLVFRKRANNLLSPVRSTKRNEPREITTGVSKGTPLS